MSSGEATMPATQLPEGFRDLEPFVADWALATEAERTHKRSTSDMAAIRAFHDAILPRMDAVLDYLNGFALDALPDDAKRLMLLTLSLAEVAPAVHFYQEPLPGDVFVPERFERRDIPNLTPKL